MKFRVDRRFLTLAWLLAAVPGCVYSFTGGGLPRHIRTIAVVAFENETPQPLLETEVETRMQDEIPRNLGVRLAAESAADAVVRGRIVAYTEEATNVQPNRDLGGAIPVVQRQVRITYEAEIYDMREDRSLWRAQSLSVIGDYQPDTESVEDGRNRAVRELVRRVIEGAQSQW